MSQISGLPISPGLLAVMVGLLLLAAGFANRTTRRSKFSKGGQYPFRLASYGRKPLLSPWERGAVDVLLQQVPPGCHLCCQVRLADMLVIHGGGPHRQSAVGRVAQLSVDFAVVEVSSGEVLLVIELDDRTHQAASRRERDTRVDAILGHVGIPIRRFHPGARLFIRDAFPALVAAPGEVVGSLSGQSGSPSVR